MSELNRKLTEDEKKAFLNLVNLKLTRKRLRGELKDRLSKEGMSKTESFVRGALEGVTGGLSEEIARGAVGFSQLVSDSVEDAERDISRAFVPDKAFERLEEKSPMTEFMREEFRKLQRDRAGLDVSVGLDVSRAQNPAATAIGDIGGTIANQLAISGLLPAGKAAQAVATLAGGALQGAGRADGDLSDRAIGGAAGGATALVGGAVTSVGSAALKSVFNPLARRLGIVKPKPPIVEQVDEFIDESVGSNFSTLSGSEGARTLGGIARGMSEEMKRAANGEYGAAAEKAASEAVYAVAKIMNTAPKGRSDFVQRQFDMDKAIKMAEIKIKSIIEKANVSKPDPNISVGDMMKAGAKVMASGMTKNPVPAASAMMDQGSRRALIELIKRVGSLPGEAVRSIQSNFNPGGIVQQSGGALPAALAGEMLGGDQ